MRGAGAAKCRRPDMNHSACRLRIAISRLTPLRRSPNPARLAAAHVVPLLTDAGIPRAQAAATMGIFGLATLGGRLLAGYLVDRFFAAYVATVLFLAPIAGFAFLANAHGVLPTIGVTLLGLGLGTEIDLIAFLVSRYFGQLSFGQLYGYCFMAFGFGSSIGRFVGGYAYDLAHSY